MATAKEKMEASEAEHETRIQKRMEIMQGKMDEWVDRTLKRTPYVDKQTAANNFFLRKFAELDEWESIKMHAEDLQRWHDNQFKH